MREIAIPFATGVCVTAIPPGPVRERLHARIERSIRDWISRQMESDEGLYGSAFQPGNVITFSDGTSATVVNCDPETNRLEISCCEPVPIDRIEVTLSIV